MAWIAVAIAAPAARADTSRVVIDRVDLEPASIGGGRLRVYVSALTREGAPLDLTDPKAIKLIAGSSELRAPYALGTFAATSTDTAIVILVQATSDFAQVLPAVTDALDQALLAQLGDRTQLAVIAYGEAVGEARLASLKSARGKTTQLSVESGSEPALADAIERALPMLKKAKTEPLGRPLRKMIIVIGDGRDAARDTGRITQLAQRAARDNVRIHALAHAPTDKRRSMLTLGELSKRSFGTFRWVRTKEWVPYVEQLRKEINEQYAVTYFVPVAADVAGKRIKITLSGVTTATSNELKVPEVACNGQPCEDGYCAGDRCAVPRAPEGRGVFGWILLLLMIAVGLLVVLGAIGYVMSRRQQAAAAGPPVPGMPAVPGVPGVPGSKPPKAKPASKPPKGPPQPAVPAAPPTSGPRLYIMTGPRAGETVGLRHGFSIGAAPTSDLVIADGYASTQHAQIAIDNAGNCWVYDRGSTNGTFVNGVRVTERALDHGTTLRIGSTDLRYLVQ